MNNEERIKFEDLPDSIRRQYHNHTYVHLCVQAYIHGRIDRDDMMERLCVRLVDENTNLQNDLYSYLRWFGAPTPSFLPSPK